MKEISVTDIRKGDRIRCVALSSGGREFTEEYTAEYSEEAPVLLISYDGHEVYLIDRPLPEVPTRPYSMIIPPRDLRMLDYYCAVLEPEGLSGTTWYEPYSGRAVPVDSVRELISEGWTVIEGPELEDGE